MNDFWDGRFIVSVPNTPTDRAVALQMLADHAMNEYEERLLFVVKRHYTLPHWYDNLPPAPAKTKIRALKPTTVYKDRNRNIIHSTKNAGDVLDYWGLHQDGWLCVFNSSTLQLWAWWEDWTVA